MLFIGLGLGLENGVGLTPFMGWNSWNKFGCDINETIIKTQADKIVEFGLDKLGYVYVNIDDCWMTSGRDHGYLITDSKRFPNGMKSLGDYIHSKGLKFGIYSSAGTSTCQKREGSLDNEEKDAELFAAFGVDLLKYDNCFNKGLSSKEASVRRYTAMSQALANQNRTILYSMCNWGEQQPWNWAENIANTFRSTADIGDRFKGFDIRCPCTTTNCKVFGYKCSVLNILDKQVSITKFGKPGFFNDMDMLEVGNGGMSYDQYKTHFILWAALKSPLIIGADLATISDEDLNLLQLEEVIKVNQDPLGKSAHLLHRVRNLIGSIQYDIWGGQLVDGSVVVIVNRTNSLKKIKTNFLLLTWMRCLDITVKDLVSLEEFDFEIAVSHSVTLQPHSSTMLKIRCKNKY
eukprot:NODE_14_length_51535_cov_1.125049.p11 type:complete len:404 gc:universal NODE_14_length_51535_cov_1.125049:23437-22226(-)